MKSFFKSILTTTLGVILGTFLTLLLVPLLFVIFFKGAKSSKSEPIQKHSILHLRLRGQIVEKHKPLEFELLGDRSIFSEDRTLGLYEINKAIDLAKNDKRFDGIYLELRDVEAGWASISAIRRHLDEFVKSGKWAYAYAERMDEMGYYLASAATETYLQPNGEIEFNGLAVNEAFLKGLLQKLDVAPRVFRVGRFKAAIEPLILDKMSDENREQNKVLLDDVWSMVRKTVATEAKMTPAKVDELASNLTVASAEDAVKYGLIKGTQFEDAVEDKMRLKTVGAENDLELVSPAKLLKDTKVGHKSGAKVAVIFAEGEISSGTGGREDIGSESLRQDIIDAREDDDVSAIVLRINSPGGDALASDVIWRELKLTDDQLPVVISMGDVAASGGYYISAAARYIFAEPTTITGSIGVFGLMFDTERLFKNKAGVNWDRVVTHQFSDIGNANRPMSKFESDMIQREVERTYKRFLDVVAEGRGYEKRADLESIAEGRVWSGVKAKELGLVDELGGLDQAIGKAAEFAELGKDYEIELYPQDKDPITSLIERVAGESVRLSLKSTLGAALGTSLGTSLGPSLGTALGPSLGGLAGKQIEKPTSATPLHTGIYARLPFDMRIR